MVLLHPVNHFSTPCTTSMASLLLSFRSSQKGRVELYIDVIVTDQHLVADTTSTYQTTLRATDILTLIVATLTTSPQGILHLVLPADFMQEATSSLPLMLKCFKRQPLKTNLQALLLSYNCYKLSITPIVRANTIFQLIFILGLNKKFR